MYVNKAYMTRIMLYCLFFSTLWLGRLPAQIHNPRLKTAQCVTGRHVHFWTRITRLCSVIDLGIECESADVTSRAFVGR